jgi:hypothetical protein
MIRRGVKEAATINQIVTVAEVVAEKISTSA